MKQPQISESAKLNFYLNLLNLVPFIILIITGLILQIEYHLHHLPGGRHVYGLSKSGWLNLHKISAVISVTGILFHCILHWKFIKAIAKKIFNKKPKTGISMSIYLFIIYIPTLITAMGAWLFFNHKDTGRFVLVEIHDKMALLLIIFFIIHIVTRFGWMVKTYQRI